VACGYRFFIVSQIAHVTPFEEILGVYPDLKIEDVSQDGKRVRAECA
jgi:hypothetical protein